MREDIKKRILEKDKTVVERIEFIDGHLSDGILGIGYYGKQFSELFWKRR